MSYTVGSLFAGYGGLEMGVGMVLDTKLAWYCEVEPAAVRVLEFRYPGVPNLGDITTVDWGQVEPVDIITGGFPCTDVSAAGQRAGLRAGTRSGLWAHMAVAIHRLQPQLVIVENVRGLLSAEADSAMEPCPMCMGDGPATGMRALGAVLGDLACIGLDAEWCVLPASAVDAAHRRERVFLAAAHPGRLGVQRRSDVRSRLADTESAGTDEGLQRQRRGHTPGDGRATPADPGGPGLERRIGAEPAPPGEREPDHARRGAATGRRSAATDTTTTDQRWGSVPRPEVGKTPCGGGRGRAEPGDRVEPVTDATGVRWGEGRGEPDRRGETSTVGDSDRTTTDTHGDGCDRGPERDRDPGGPRLEASHRDHPDRCPSPADWAGYRPAIERWEHVCGRPAPAPTVLGTRGGPQLSPLFVEWLMGLDAGWVTAVPGLTRTQQLKLLGNGCVPQQVALALRVLLPRLFDDREAAA